MADVDEERPNIVRAKVLGICSDCHRVVIEFYTDGACNDSVAEMHVDLGMLNALDEVIPEAQSLLSEKH